MQLVSLRTVWSNCIKECYFLNRLSGFTGDQSYHGCLQAGAQGKIVFTMTVSTLFSTGGFEKIRTYLERRKRSDHGLIKRSTNYRKSLASEDNKKKTGEDGNRLKYG